MFTFTTDYTLDAEVTFSSTGSSSTHYLCSGKVNPKIEIPISHVNSEKLLAGREKLLGGP